MKPSLDGYCGHCAPALSRRRRVSARGSAGFPFKPAERKDSKEHSDPEGFCWVLLHQHSANGSISSTDSSSLMR